MCDFETSIWDTLDFGSAESAEADELRSALSADEAEISEIRARQVERLRRADRLQLDTADGFRIMADWVVANLDVSPQTARRMMRIARAQHPLRDLCTGKARVIVCGEDGRPIGVSDLEEAIPPAVRRFVLQRDQGRCQIDGCQSRYRIQPHHIRRRAWGGDHDPGNLVSLCWYHHHVAIHQMGMTFDPTSPPHRR
jgi:hypothetical protein